MLVQNLNGLCCEQRLFMIKVKTSKEGRVCQGDIFKDIELVEYIHEKNGILEISKINYPFVIVLTQDCELQQDYNFRKSLRTRYIQNKMLLSVLVAPLYNADQVFLGQHLSDLSITVEAINKNKTPGKNLIQNETPRYHYLDFPSNIPIVPSIIDFKHYFSVNVEYLRRLKYSNFICKVSELYREDISMRFANYLARIGLP